MIKLVEQDGLLHLGSNVLFRFYPGNIDTICWPMAPEETENLASALYDCRETGLLPSHCTSVLLPDGDLFDIDPNLPEPKDWDWS